ncbi:MAG: hypothetical protein ACR650_09670 [Methylocystis sp.]
MSEEPTRAEKRRRIWVIGRRCIVSGETIYGRVRYNWDEARRICDDCDAVRPAYRHWPARVDLGARQDEAAA